jgi:hypothetical protein
VIFVSESVCFFCLFIYKECLRLRAWIEAEGHYCINLLFYKKKTVVALEKILESQMPAPEDL